jgi:hypothetical protein
MTVTVATLGERALRRLGVAIVPVADRPALSVVVPAATLATGALVELGVIAADEAPAPADQALALAKVSAVHDALVAQAVVPWALEDVPQAVSEEYIKLAANIMASSFGKPGDPAIHAALEVRVRRVALVMGAPELATEAVMAVHRDLTARGLARWSVFDIPGAVEAPYVMLAANDLAPQFAQQANPRDDVAAMRSIAQYIALPTSGEHVHGEFF